MEVITISSEAFLQITKRLDSLESYFKHVARQQPLSEAWLDIEEACRLLKVSKRTLQSYRDEGILSYSQIGGKIYFSASAIEEHLKSHTRKAFKKTFKQL
ncbi:MAG: helix-turn-helix domain-containing protein [Bacteroidota bacterium]